MYNILIVDDEPIILDGLQSIIVWEEYGLEIAGLAANGVKALDILNHQPVDILLTDIKMPEMNGLDLIDCIRQRNWNIKVIVLSGHDDFEFVKGAIRLGVENYLLKPVNKDELSLTLLNTIDKIARESNRAIYETKSRDVFRQNLLYRWVTGNISLRELQERASLIDIRLQNSGYLVAALYFLENAQHADAPAVSQVMSICSAAKPAGICTEIFNDLNDHIILLFSDDRIEDRKQEISDYLQRCVSQINVDLGISVFVTIGLAGQDFQEVGRSFASARDLQEYSLIYPPGSVLDAAAVKRAVSAQHRSIAFDMEQFYEIFAGRRKSEAVLLIEEYYNQVLAIEGISPRDIQNISIEILSGISGLFKRATRNLVLPHDLEIMFSDMTKIKTSQELISWMTMVVGKMIDCLSNCEDSQNPLIKHIIKYVNNHYADALSLKTISSMHNVNTSYLGQLFKNETGELFTNYLNGVRIQKAKVMLAQTNYRVYDIAEKVGYINQSLFFRTFRKLTGLSPEEFREKNLLE